MNRTVLIVVIIVVVAIVALLLVCACLACGVVGLTLNAMSVPTAQELEGSRWHMVYEGPISGHTEFDIMFHPEGQLEIHRAGYVGKHTWELDGNKIRIGINNDYAVYEGQFSGRDFVSGTAKNKQGNRSPPLPGRERAGVRVRCSTQKWA